MKRPININEQKVEYNLIRKKVKNINLRINSAGEITVSANKSVSISYIEMLLLSKANFIVNALKTIENRNKISPQERFSSEDFIKLINEYCESVYPYYHNLTSIDFPIIKLRKMKSRWGSCCPTKGILTFNKNLIFAPKECIEYVILHEFTHFIHPNHSPLFYEELSKKCPDWKKLKKQLNEIPIPKT